MRSGGTVRFSPEFWILINLLLSRQSVAQTTLAELAPGLVFLSILAGHSFDIARRIISWHVKI